MMWKVRPFISSPNQVVAKFQRNGALSVKNQPDKTQPYYKILWHNGVDGDSKYTLQLHDDGEVDISNALGQVEWSTYSFVPSSRPVIFVKICTMLFIAVHTLLNTFVWSF